jgi:hypothetical protein
MPRTTESSCVNEKKCKKREIALKFMVEVKTHACTHVSIGLKDRTS